MQHLVLLLDLAFKQTTRDPICRRSFPNAVESVTGTTDIFRVGAEDRVFAMIGHDLEANPHALSI